MQIELTSEMEELVRCHVASGRYPSAQAVIEDAIQTLEERDRQQKEELERFRLLMQQTEEELDRGDVVDPEEMFSRLRERGRLMKQAAA